MNISIFSHTPAVTVRDARGLAVRELQYRRHPDIPDLAQTLFTRHGYDARGQLSHSTDPRLYDLMQTDSTVRPNFTYQSALSGFVLRTGSVDAGTTVALADAAGRPALAVSATGTVRTWQYEDTALPGRVLSITEQAAGQTARITERFVWADASVAQKNLNLAGQCVRHYDTAGRVQLNSQALTGTVLSQGRQLLPDDHEADWQGAEETAWGNPFTDGVHVTLSTTDASGAALTTTDAAGNLQRMAYDVAGQLKGSWLTLKDGQEQVIVRSLTYSAAGQTLQETHGNGVVTTYTYEPQTQRLTGIKTERPAGHPGGAKVLQDLRYDYDPVGNVLKVTNDAEATRFWGNQKVVPESTYVYDSLYQLVSVTGREMASAGQAGAGQSPAAAILPVDSNAYTNYSRAYTYDTAGNLTQIRHCSPAAGNSYTTNITVSDKSNRGVLSSLTAAPSQAEALFTAGGQQTQLLPGQRLDWNARGELARVTPVVRPGQASDSERYRYDGGSQRVSKTTVQQTNNSVQTQRVVYLPGLERRTTANGSTVTEALDSLMVSGSGRAQVRVLHWESGKPTDISNNQVRYSYGDLIQSAGLEVDGDGYIISQEEYYPFGGTAVLAARNRTEVSYKTIRYSGKERDATGLYYYGYRYYQPWAGRWLSADPAGTVDGLNLFRMVRNNPGSLRDGDGRAPKTMWKNIVSNSVIEGKVTKGAQQSYFVTSYGEAASFDLPFPEYSSSLEHEWIDATFYEKAFYSLSKPEKEAVRSWTALEDPSKKCYSDETPAFDDGINYELNQKLSEGTALSDEEKSILFHLDSALPQLPAVKGSFLRVSEFEGIPAFLSHVSVGDIVTNYPRFMSVSSKKEYALNVTSGSVNNDKTTTLSYYHIDGSPVPLMRGVASLADEDEFIFPRRSYFRVKDLEVAVLFKTQADDFPERRIGMLLEQISGNPGLIAKNIHTGEQCRVMGR